jgi:hypothetical protein
MKCMFYDPAWEKLAGEVVNGRRSSRPVPGKCHQTINEKLFLLANISITYHSMAKTSYASLTSISVLHGENRTYSRSVSASTILIIIEPNYAIDSLRIGAKSLMIRILKR